jgi:phage gpG-like protein
MSSPIMLAVSIASGFLALKMPKLTKRQYQGKNGPIVMQTERLKKCLHVTYVSFA